MARIAKSSGAHLTITDADVIIRDNMMNIARAGNGHVTLDVT